MFDILVELLKRKMLCLVMEQTAVFIQTAGRLSQKSRMKVKWWHITNIIIMPCRDRKTCHFIGGGGVGGILCNISCDVHNEFTFFFFSYHSANDGKVAKIPQRVLQ